MQHFPLPGLALLCRQFWAPGSDKLNNDNDGMVFDVLTQNVINQMVFLPKPKGHNFGLKEAGQDLQVPKPLTDHFTKGNINLAIKLLNLCTLARAASSQ